MVKQVVTMGYIVEHTLHLLALPPNVIIRFDMLLSVGHMDCLVHLSEAKVRLSARLPKLHLTILLLSRPEVSK